MSNSDTHVRRELEAGCTVIADTVARTAELRSLGDYLSGADRLYFLGCGSSYWVGEIGAAAFRSAGVDARAVASSEFLFSSYPVSETTAVVGLSQSGQTTETVRALERVERRGGMTAAVTNTAGSTLDRTAEASVVTPAGEERAVLATKSVDAAVAATTSLTDGVGASGSYEAREGVVDACRAMLETDVTPGVELLRGAERAYALGTDRSYGLAGECATKLGEGGLIGTTPLPALEVTHGPISNAAGVPVLLFALDTDLVAVYEDLLVELDDAGAETLVVHPPSVEYVADVSVEVPTGESVLPALKYVQRLTLAVALDRGLDPDNPPELSKYVSWDSL